MSEVSTKACPRRGMKISILVLALVLGALALNAPPVAADRVGICPDGFVRILAASVPNGEKKDQNGNGFVCAKFSDGRLVGGPDDDTII